MYVPNGGKDYPAKLRFLESLSAWVGDTLASGRGLIVCGDLNVAREERDIHPKERKPGQIGARPEERELFAGILGRGLVDVGRKLDPDNDDLFTWWAPWRNLRQRNIGWRIDYVLMDERQAARAQSAVSRRDFGTSDHAPVVVTCERAMSLTNSADRRVLPALGRPAGGADGLHVRQQRPGAARRRPARGRPARRRAGTADAARHRPAQPAGRVPDGHRGARGRAARRRRKRRRRSRSRRRRRPEEPSAVSASIAKALGDAALCSEQRRGEGERVARAGATGVRRDRRLRAAVAGSRRPGADRIRASSRVQPAGSTAGGDDDPADAAESGTAESGSGLRGRAGGRRPPPASPTPPPPPSPTPPVARVGGGAAATGPTGHGAPPCRRRQSRR